MNLLFDLVAVIFGVLFLNCYSNMVDKLQKNMHLAAASILNGFLEPLFHHWHVSILSLFYNILFCLIRTRDIDLSLNVLIFQQRPSFKMFLFCPYL